MDFGSLSEAQKRAVTFTGKHLLVLGGAGTGKTRVIIARALWLMEQGVDPGTILVLSNTTKSAWEIVDRIKSEAGDAQAAKALRGSSFLSWSSGDYTNILIDEMQEIAPQQWSLLESLSDSCHFFCAGDDAQSIFAFQGADFRSIRSFAERVPGGEVIELTDNYRSTQEILDLANWLLRQSHIEYDRELRAVRGKGQIPELYFCHGRPKEAELLLTIIQRGLLAGKKYSDYMILSRASKRVEELTNALKGAGIPVIQMGGSKSHIDLPHVRDVIDALRILINYRDDLSWRRFLKLWTFEGWFDAAAFMDAAMGSSSLDEALSRLPRTDAVSRKIADCLTSARNCRNEPAAAFGIVLSYMTPIMARMYQDWDACMADLERVRLMAVTCETIPAFVEEYATDPIAALVRHGVEEKPDSVIISTVHSAKGIECDTVIVLAREFPSYWCRTDETFEEERRILYVALTRARNSLILTTTDHQRMILPEEQRNDTTKSEHRLLLDAEPFFRGIPDGLLATFPKPGIQRTYTATVDIDADIKLPELDRSH